MAYLTKQDPVLKKIKALKQSKKTETRHRTTGKLLQTLQ